MSKIRSLAVDPPLPRTMNKSIWTWMVTAHVQAVTETEARAALAMALAVDADSFSANARVQNRYRLNADGSSCGWDGFQPTDPT